ncbi:U4/U6-U5 snRNP complex subunit prp31 [Cyanidiococcus yangmingshanensis]|uniref:U4/U6-U5 snRNP complex subunit prp31 n=1 Tax=Cyanidiococcus yangmingshanensis TaxID=2690220 RepID=A0A7J7IJY2_9RHOD|nr:U4/U6-U5 snRNP complex subunit prp31 [Cyanidiococcus yangmingshanensis]
MEFGALHREAHETHERFELEAAAIRSAHEALLAIYGRVLDRYEERLPGISTLTTDPQCGLEVIESLGNRAPPLSIMAIDTSSWPPEITMGLAVLIRRLGRPLSDWEAVEQLIQEGKKLAKLEKQRMSSLCDRVDSVAPNLCALTGKNFAARVLGWCGGLLALVKLPADQLRLVGARDISVLYGPRRLRGLLFECPLLRDMLTEMERAGIKCAGTDLRLIRRMARQLGNRIAFVARVDCFERKEHRNDVLAGTRARNELLSLWRKEVRSSKWDDSVDETTGHPLFGHARALPIPRPWERRRGRGGGKRTQRKRRARLAAKTGVMANHTPMDDEIEFYSEPSEDEE